MDSEFPDPDEEFDLIHENEYEVLKEIEELEKSNVKIENLEKKQKEKNKLNTSIPNVYKELNIPTSNKYNEVAIASTSKTIECNDNFDIDITKKRNYDELFGDISDMLDINTFVDIQEPKDKKPRWDQPQEVIKAVLDARQKFNEYNRGVSVNRKHAENKRESISLRVPRWNFVAVTRPCDAQRIYIRVKSNEQCEIKRNIHSISNLLSVPFSQIKAEAEEIMVQNAMRASRETSYLPNTNIAQDDELWVDKYKPRSYIELLSDESVNRDLLHWLKLWDKIVFNRNYTQKKKKLNSTLNRFKNRKFIDEKTFKEVDNKGFPIQRIVLLSGPPGLGKTTLAHLAAKHAGYNVIEINASDERSPDTFRQILLASTQMKAVMGSDPRPNCLILDEIDGAPAASIDLLLKFIQGKLIPKGKKDKMNTDKSSNICHRPIICICNEPYTPSLRALRTVALIISVPEVSSTRLADRLMEISQKENLKVNPDALLTLVEISGCDIRSCLGALQYMGGINSKDNLSFALKDSRKGLFDSWKQILTIPMNRSGILSISERIRLVLNIVQNGELEKLAQGIFHNYPEICNNKLYYIALCLQWFQFFDEILSLVANLQVWSVMPYLNYAFVTWHLYFAKSRNAKLFYPSILYEMNQKHARNIGILSTIQRSSGRNSIILTIDIAPFFPDLLSSRLRTVSGHLHSMKEKEDISRIVNILINFGLTFTQEKKLDGTYDYKLDPNIFEISIFPNCKYHRTLTYPVKQILVQELEAERLRRAANAIKNVTKCTQNKNENAIKENTTTNSKEDLVTKTCNNIISIESKEAQTKEIKYKDFFGRVITVSQDKQNKYDKETISSQTFLSKNDVWFKYKEGFSNAVRRKVIMEDLL
ncbi:chromosome transmission fidelity protein 18 [Apis mellifera carnica]|uniref:Chromosome transmission fidelity protein 18 homolog n=1 Tax=Apis mellifera TaxID=7460 RepID=A0A7M7G000_APIME|nr:chromosome transmission fidelity protein 18 homolog [Apis mellifera]KAG9437378.1 chromosome transmission fidelity protein 18 [Apis mellifera carnica]|eukprot:XP_001122463.2 chromosome transmission fidelity protein 18 homolog [Apis mellifera]